MERKIRFISITVSTGGIHYTAWFYVLGREGRPKWCHCCLSSISYNGYRSPGFEAVRRANICPMLSSKSYNRILLNMTRRLLGLLRIGKIPSLPN